METIKNLEGNIKAVLTDLERYERIKQKRAEIHHRYYLNHKDTYDDKKKERLKNDPEFLEREKERRKQYYINVEKPRRQALKNQSLNNII